MSKNCLYFISLFYSYMVFGSVVNSFRCAFLRGIKCFLLWKNISNFAEATREKRFTTMMPLGMSCDVKCHRLCHHNCFSNSIQFDLIYFISIWTSQNLLKIRTFLCIIKRNKLFNHPSYISCSRTTCSSRSVPFLRADVRKIDDNIPYICICYELWHHGEKPI